jgi:glycosyltransferase involved in cell wall biosynthesis
MIVLHVLPNGDLTSGGAAYASVRLAHEQARLGSQVYVFEINPDLRIKADWWCDAVKYFDFEAGISLIRKLLFFFNLFLNEKKIIVHFHGVWIPKFYPYFLLALYTNTSYIISPHGSLEPGALRQKFFKKYIARKLFFNFFLSNAISFWACSEKELISIKSLFPKAQVDIVPIGVDIPSQEPLLHYVNVLKQQRIILVISRLNPGKGLINLVKAWNSIRDENWHFIIAGPDDEGYQKKIEEEITKLNLTNFFTFLGYINSIQRDHLYRNADLFVLPSLSENFGIVVAEAMSYGLPVLTTNETPWTYVGLNRGCLCVGTNPCELSQGLINMMSINDTERFTMAIASRKFIEKNFAWLTIARLSKNKLKYLIKY